MKHNYFSLACLMFLSVFLAPIQLFATHQKAGEIIYIHISGNKYKARIITYTNTKQTPTSQPPDRDKLEIFWGDGQSDTINRVNGPNGMGDTIDTFTKKNIYEGVHTYQGPGSYILSFVDQNRNDDVDNMVNSVQQAFYVQTKLVINFGTTGNNSPILLQPPIDHGTFNQLYIHNPNAYDPDGDSLSYEITDCRGLGGSVCQGYYLPQGLPAFQHSVISINAVTGDFIWKTPEFNSQKMSGEYLFNFAIIIREWRRLSNGNLINIGYVTRDFQVEIENSTNQPPQILAHDTCVEAGSTLLLDIIATDPDNNETVTISATGEPFELSNSPALIDTSNVSGVNSATYNFKWSTNCSHIRKNPYHVIFKAKDNNPQVNLVDLKTVKITVVGPAPKNPTAISAGDSITVRWDACSCQNAKGYYIYRRENKANFIPDYCETGVPSFTGYVRIANNIGVTDTVFYDSNNGAGLSPAVDYCYIITAYFNDGAEGYASTEVCAMLNRDLPVITNVDVQSTSSINGSIYIAWSPPVDLDTIQYPGPFAYVLQRADAGSSVYFDVVTLNNWNDTTYIENSLNTAGNQYKYRVKFYYNVNIYLGSSQEATSIYLKVAPGDNKAKLSWSLSVPWTNNYFYIYRKTISTTFILIDTAYQTNYIDYSVFNDSTYCYYVESEGFYADSGLVFPILNRSQEACVIPFDNEGPCTAILTAATNCDSNDVMFSWNFITDSCNTTDIDYFTVYYSPSQKETFDSVGYFNTNAGSFSFTRYTMIGGCYYITSTDTNGNKSDFSNIVCIESCPLFSLPNAFSPDGNGINDLFTPIELPGTGLYFRDIKDVTINIYNRWGAIVFKTEDPAIKWNGKRNNDGQDVPEGTYFYTCIVHVIGQPEDAEPLKFHGAIQLFRNGNSKQNN